MMARSSFLILPACRSSSKNRFNSSSVRAVKKSASKSPFSKRCKHHDAAASDINNSTSPFSQLPDSITTDGIVLSCNFAFEATSTGVELKSSERVSGKLFNSSAPRQCSRHESPSAIAFHEGPSRSSSTPTKAANDPLRAFSSEYHDRVRPFHESCSSRPSSATHLRKSSSVSVASLRTQCSARFLAHCCAWNASVAPSVRAKRAVCASKAIASSHSEASWSNFGSSSCRSCRSQVALCLAELKRSPFYPSICKASCR